MSKYMKYLTGITVLVLILQGFGSWANAQEEDKVSIKKLTEEMDRLKADYEKRIGDLELRAELMETLDDPGTGGEADSWYDAGDAAGEESYGTAMGVSPGTMGRLGQTTRFSNTFNPAVGVVVDAIASRTHNRKTTDNLDKFWFRAAELNLSAQVDPFGFAYATLEGSEDDIELIEAAAVMNRLPANFSVKGGLFLSDFGKFGQRHDHELPFVEKPLVYYDYVGGSVNSAGVEVHQWFGLTDTIPVRWSVGMLNDMEGHSHTLWFGEGHEHGHASTEFGVNDKRQLDNFAYTGRLAGYGDLSESSSLHMGGSVLWAPEKVEVHEESWGDMRIDTRQTVAGVDVTYKWIDPTGQEEFIAGVEGFKSHGTFYHEADEAVMKGNAHGGYAWGEYAWDPHWCAGAMGGAFERARHDNVGQRELSAWITWKVSHFNWLRLQYRFNDLERHGTEFTGRDFSEILLQWTLVFGTHAHGLDW